MKLLYALFFCMFSCLCVSEALTWPSFCCLKTNSIERLPVKNVAECKVQSSGLCPIDAIIIKTHKGRMNCYDPKAEWVVKNVVMKETNSCDITIKKRGKGQKRKQGREK
ncbi:hypothetical protein HF521_010759 [Silurus meridionalis]|uniref:Chemokine interleukin-8-like domain-containing protein n=1 Tax=Silurus meridionalis TaxID=175797 RepID=A0A8T0AH80_SILME|nr:hypothetical protein HF521_010759 [Silurus meridionalis]